MKYNKINHLKLLENYLELQQLNKDLFHENPENWFKLIDYQILVSDQIYWTKRKKFMALIFDFITSKINYTEFETEFSLLFQNTQKQSFILTRDISYIEKFEYIPASEKFGTYMTIIYRCFEEVEDEYWTEQELKDYAMKVFMLIIQ